MYRDLSQYHLNLSPCLHFRGLIQSVSVAHGSKGVVEFFNGFVLIPKYV